MKKRRRRLVLGAAAVLLLALCLPLYVNHLRSKNALLAYKAQLIAKGEKLKIEELLPPPPPERNGAALFGEASVRFRAWNKLFDNNPPPTMRMVAPGRAMVGWAQPDIREDATNTWEEAEAALNQINEALRSLEALIDLPTLDFHLDYLQGPNLMLTHLASLKQAAQRLSAAAMCDLHRGDAASAATRVRTILALVKGTEHERVAISQLVRIANAHIALAANWALLQSPDLTEAQLAAVQSDWAGLQFIAPAESALVMERAFGEETIARMRRSSSEFRRLTAPWGGGAGTVTASTNLLERAGQLTKEAWDEARTKTKVAMWQNAWSYTDELRWLQGEEALIEAMRLVRAGQPFNVALSRQKSRLAGLGIQERDDGSVWMGGGLATAAIHVLFSQNVLSLERLLSRLFKAEAARQLVVTSIALKRYQLRHGSYPAALAELSPEFLPAVPADPMDGQPLRYRRNPDGGFLLYSLGEDGKDDGGDASLPAGSRSVGWVNGRDLVWPQPATPAEVAAYYEKRAAERGRPSPLGASVK